MKRPSWSGPALAIAAVLLGASSALAAPSQKRAPDEASSSSSSLEREVERLIEGFRRRGRVRPDERTSWSVYDFTSGRKLVSINEDEAYESASLIKPLVALAFFDAVSRGRQSYGREERRRMEAMLHRSDNFATNWFLRRLGGPASVHRLLKARYGGLLTDLQLVEYIPRGGRTYRNKASAHDYSRFLYALWNGGLPGSNEIKRLMRLPNRDRLAADLPSDIVVFDKTGSTSRLCGEMAILVAPGPDDKPYPFILIGMIQKDGKAPRYGDWIRRRGDVIRAVSKLVYRDITRRHGFDERSASTPPPVKGRVGG